MKGSDGEEVRRDMLTMPYQQQVFNLNNLLGVKEFN